MASGRATGFRFLASWQKAQTLATECCLLVDRLPGKRAADILGGQLLRSAASVPANIAEGYGRYSPGAYRNHLSIARGSLTETESHIDLLQRAAYINDSDAQRLVSICDEISRLLTTSMRSMSTPSVREEGAAYEA
jgi:four helix bundle protein